MTTYNQIIDRTGAAPLMVPEQVADQIFGGIVGGSSVFQLATRLPDMNAKTMRLPVASSLAQAYFVNGDTGLKQTTQLAWQNKYIEAEELAVIVPIPENVLDDSAYPIWPQVQPQVVRALYQAIDQAVLYGTNKPSTWPTGVVTAAVAAGNYVPATSDLYTDIMVDGGLLQKVELDGYAVTGHVGALSVRGKLRGTRDTTGQPIFVRDGGVGTIPYQLDGTPIVFPLNGSVDPAQSLLISGDWSQLVYSIRKDITFKVFTEGVITDNSNPPQIIYNLMQQDMVAMRVVIRLGWQLPNPINQINTDSATRYPFAVLTP